MNLTTNPSLFAALLPPPTAAVAAGWLPTSIFPGWSEDGSDITLPIASVLDLTADIADAVTGDGRQVAWSLAKTIFSWYNNLDVVPGGITAKYSPGSVQISGSYVGKQKASITITAYLDYPDETVAAEV